MSNLITIDLICHGIPSKDIQEQYIKYVEKKEKTKAVSVNYRDKKEGWHSNVYSLELENGKIIKGNLLTILFSQSYSLNHTCFDCKYTTINRNSSLTIGDFWGGEKFFDSNVQINKRGMSICLARDKRIIDVLEKVKNPQFVIFKNLKVDDCLQGNLLRPTPRPKDYDKFKKSYARNKKRTILRYALPLKRRIKRLLTKSPLKSY